MVLKTNINLWDISYREDGLEMNTIFNSGFIDDADVVKRFFIEKNPGANDVIVKKNEENIKDVSGSKFSNRVNALNWWNNWLTVFERRRICTKYFSGRRLSTLTGREIEKMWKDETV